MCLACTGCCVQSTTPPRKRQLCILIVWRVSDHRLSQNMMQPAPNFYHIIVFEKERESSLILEAQCQENVPLKPRFLKSCKGVWEKYKYSFGQPVWVLAQESCLYFQTSFYSTNLGMPWKCRCLPSRVIQLEGTDS